MGAIGKAELVMRVLENLSKKGGFSAIELNEHFKSTMNETTVYRILKGPEDEGILHFFKGIDRLQGTAGC